MKYLYILLFLCIFTDASSQVREYMLVSGEWKFTNGIIEPDTPDNAGWKKITVPHTWNKEDGIGDENREYYRGAGIYSKILYIPEKLKNKRLFLRFEAVSVSAEDYTQ